MNLVRVLWLCTSCRIWPAVCSGLVDRGWSWTDKVHFRRRDDELVGGSTPARSHRWCGDLIWARPKVHKIKVYAVVNARGTWVVASPALQMVSFRDTALISPSYIVRVVHVPPMWTTMRHRPFHSFVARAQFYSKMTSTSSDNQSNHVYVCTQNRRWLCATSRERCNSDS